MSLIAGDESENWVLCHDNKLLSVFLLLHTLFDFSSVQFGDRNAVSNRGSYILYVESSVEYPR